MTVEIHVFLRQLRARVVLDADKAAGRALYFDIASELVCSVGDDCAEYEAAHVVETLKVTRQIRYEDEIRVRNVP